MSNANIQSTYFRGQGAIWIGTRNSAGLTSALYPIGDADKLEIQFKETFDDARESISGLRTRTVHTSIQNDVEFSMDVLNTSGEALGLAVLGLFAPATAGTVTSEAIIGSPGKVAFTQYPNISAVVLKAGSTTLVAGTDYVVGDASSGRIEFLTGGAVTLNEALTISYSYAAVSNVVEALTNLGNREVFIVFEGVNMNQQNTPVKVKLPRVYINLANMLSLISTATNKFTITGAVLPAPEITTSGLSKFFNVTIASQNTLFVPV